MEDAKHQERIVRLLAQTQERLLRYVFVLLPDWDSAQEIIQNTHVVIWKKSSDFTSSSDEDFYRWAKQVAFFETKKLLTLKASSPSLLDPELAKQISDDFGEMDDDLDVRRSALSLCIEKLPDKDRELLRLRYWGDDTVSALSKQLGRTVGAVYKSLQRIRQALLNCIERELRKSDT